MAKLNKIETRVIDILESFPFTRNSDKDLIMHYGYKYHSTREGAEYFGTMIRRIPPIESITRARRKIQAKGLLNSDKQIAKTRKLEEEKPRQYYSRKSNTVLTL